MKNSIEIARGKVFVAGLHWQPLGGISPSEVKNEAKRMAEELTFDLIVWRRSSSEQVGYAASGEGYAPGMLSAAAMVSKSIEIQDDQRDFIVATELPDGRFLYVAQADSVIVPDGDQIGSADQIRGRMLEDLSMGKAWSFVVAPVMWGIPGSVERKFEDFLPTKKGKVDLKHSWWALREVKTNYKALLRKMLPVIAGVMALGGGAFAYKQYVAEQARILAEQQALEAQAQVQAISQQVTVPPWATRQPPVVAAASCIAAFDSIKTLWPGNWVPQKVICLPDTGSLTAMWNRGPNGWIAHLQAEVPKATITPDGTAASLIDTFKVEAPVDDKPVLQAEQVRSLQLVSLGQQLGVNLTVSAPQQAAPLPGAAAPATPPSPWKELHWAVKGTQLSPIAIVDGLNGPGLRIDSITALFNNGQITWDVEGSQYVAQ